ncbi:hypothetical protein [Variovorax atrisoli]|uniref:hypothetical protein n=1 Tax=Variovorax atrisoli TaxID=3394203 RepID=UPI001ABF8F4A|nr:hypothetical protein [Variovorax paradoxus]
MISHDCDIAQLDTNEPYVEVIVGRFVEGPANGNYTNSKNLRKLQIECTSGTTTKIVELEIAKRCALPKNTKSEGSPALGDYAPCTAQSLSRADRNTLQIWLAARYRRAAFPDEFDRRLDAETKVAERLAKVFKDSGKHIVAVFFDVDQGEEKTRTGATDPYELHVTLLYRTDEDPRVAEAAAKDASKRITTIFNDRCTAKDAKGNVVHHWIELIGVDVISDQAMTYADSQLLKKWQADHISLRIDPPQPLLGS